MINIYSQLILKWNWQKKCHVLELYSYHRIWLELAVTGNNKKEKNITSVSLNAIIVDDNQ